MFNLEVKSKLTFQQREAVDQLIFTVWSHEQTTGADVEVISSARPVAADPLDQNAVHVLVTDQTRLVGYGRLTLFHSKEDAKFVSKEIPAEALDTQSAYISRLVVHPMARGRGIATLIDETRISIAKAYGVRHLIGCAVGVGRQSSLTKAGFESTRPVDYFETPWYRTTRPVQLMVMDLNSDHQAAESF